LLKQALDQIVAVGTHRLHWVVADQSLADHIRKIFAENDVGRERIDIIVVPFVSGQSR